MVIREYLRLKPGDKDFRDLFRKVFGFKPKTTRLYRLAFIHRSAKPRSLLNNERLEFLGDAILSSVVSELCYTAYPGASEGFLSQMRSKIVNRESMNSLALKMGIERLMDYNRKISTNGDFVNDIFGNSLEALIGATYLDKGYTFTKKFIEKRIIQAHVDVDELKIVEKNFKGRLFEFGQQKKTPIKFLIKEEMEGQHINYLATVLVNDELMGEGRSSRKKNAEQAAARAAWEKLRPGRRDK